MKFEYKEIENYDWPRYIMKLEFLNELGIQRWELVDTLKFNTYRIYIFKRELKE